MAHTDTAATDIMSAAAAGTPRASKYQGCTNSIADALPEDKDTNILGFRPYGFICSDGAIGLDNSGLAALEPANAAGIPGAAVSAATARMDDGHSTYFDGIISACNDLALAAGVRVGQAAKEAAHLLVTR
jgi:hypothetical protein